MGKRSSMGGDPAGKPRKRVKLVHEVPTSEEIHTSRQLQGLLAPDQDLKKARHGMLGSYEGRSNIALTF
jgi:nucleolar pre-ribosomal-associated protein 1